VKAGYLIAPTQIEVREIELPVVAPGGVVVRVKVALTDGTDLKAFRRGHPQMPMPTRFGHEFSGDVVAVGPGVHTFAVGDAIMCVHSAPDGTCYWCLRGEEELCESVMGTKILGAYAEYIAVPAHIVAQNAYRKPPDLSYEAAAFLEPLSCVVNAQRQLGARPGDSVAIVGTGGFGILHALVVRALGGTPILIGRHPERLAFAQRLGVAAVIDSRARDPEAAVMEHTFGRGADAVIESTGAREVWEFAPALVRRGGTVVLFGGLPGGTRVSYDAARLHYDEVKLISPFHFTPRAVRQAYELLASHEVDVEPLISERFALAELEAAFQKLAEGSGLKFALVP
jgi:L-iditol 2-dehydrogenase